VRSFLAALRSLVLPYGATSGGRIVLDGVNGVISIYDASGFLLAKLSPAFGFEGYDTAGNVRIRVSSPLGGQYSAIQMWTAVAEETSQALFSLADFGNSNRLVITGGEQSGRGSLEWTIRTAGNDDTTPSLLQAVALTLDAAGNLRPIIDLTGAAAPSESVRPRTVMYDHWSGTPNSFGEAPTMLRSLGRGVVGYGESNGNISIGAVARPTAWVAGITINDVPVVAGRRYRVLTGGWFDWVTGGSGFAVGDLYQFEAQVDAGAGFVSLTKPAFQQFRTNVAVVGRWIVPTLVGYYDASADGIPDFRFVARGQAGAATETMVVTDNGQLNRGTLLVEDIGATP
jgi:hypothetical protein